MGSRSTTGSHWVKERLEYLARETAHEAPQISLVLLALSREADAEGLAGQTYRSGTVQSASTSAMNSSRLSCDRPSEKMANQG